MRKLLSLTLALALVLTMAGPALAAREGVPYGEMAYEPYDPAPFYDMTDKLTELAEGDDVQAVIDLYEALYGQYVLADTAYTLAQLHHSADVTDQYWTDEMLDAETVLYDASDAFCQACYAVLQGPCGKDLAAYIGQDAADALDDYEPMTDRESELLERESELTAEYDETMASSDGLTHEYGGQVWTADMLNGPEGYGLDDESYDEVYTGLQKARNDQLGPLFLELVQVRTELGDIWGYGSYAAYSYAEVYGRDFTPEDAQELCDAVKELAAEYNESLYYSDVWYMTGDVSPVMDGDTLIQVLGDYVGRVDPSLTEPWQFMTENGLYDLPTLSEEPTAEDGGYTVTIAQYESPFIYNALYGDCYDLDGLSHEFGHYANAYFAPAPNELLSVGSYDLFEIHSTALESLFTEFYGEIYDDGADIARFIVLGSLIESVIDGCIQDEFQRRVYDDPDMTLDDVNALYASVCREYGRDLGPVDYSWQYVSHTFQSPFYYLSYAVSALAAIQIWDMAQTDWDAAVDAYLDVLHRGGYEDGYMAVLSGCGLRLFTEDGAVEDICRPLLDRLYELEDAVLYAEAAA